MKWIAVIAVGLAASFAAAPMPSRAQTPPPVPQQQPAAKFYYSDNGKPMGPFTIEEMKQKIAAGLITPDTLVWTPGMPSWVALRQLASGGDDQPAQPQQPALAGAECGGKHVVMADDFTDAQKWAGEGTTVETGKLKFKPSPDSLQWSLYARPVTTDATVCVTLQVPHRFNDANSTFGGVVIAAQDTNNFYAFCVDPTGSAVLIRAKDKKFSKAIEWREVEGVKTDPGAKNQLRVTKTGNTYTMFINGTKFDQFTPEGNGSKIGVLVKSEKDRADAWKFANLKVTDNQ